jgi:hypothetical protein
MTIREYLANRTRKVIVVEVILFVLTIALSTLGIPIFKKEPYLHFVLLVPLFIIVSIQLKGFRCGRCKQRLGELTLNLTGWKFLGKKVNFCPCCGVNLDEKCDL